MRTAFIAGSTRRGSVNVALAEHLADVARSDGHEAILIDLADHPLPLFHADEEETEGVHASAHSLVSALDGIDALVIASPEYNGGFTPVLKNAIDWATRVEKTVWARTPVGLIAATPGGGGGHNGVSLLRTMLGNMRVNVIDAQVNVAHTADAFDGDGALVRDADRRQVVDFLTDLATAVDEAQIISSDKAA